MIVRFLGLRSLAKELILLVEKMRSQKDSNLWGEALEMCHAVNTWKNRPA